MRVLLLPLALATAACGSSKSDLTIINGTEERISSIQLAAGGDVWYLDDLEAGQVTKFTARVSGDGGPRVSWKWRDQIHADDACYYTAGFGYGYGPKGRLEINGSEMEILRCE